LTFLSRVRPLGLCSSAKPKRAAGVTLSIPAARGRMALGAWQGVYLAEHRTGAKWRST
jgi:hypothetical protein